MKCHRILGTMFLVLLAGILFFVPVVSANACNCVPHVPVPVPVVVVLPVNYEQSISFNDSDLGVVLYKAQEDGSNKMDVYVLTNNGATSTYLFSITQADLAPYAGHNPAKDTLLASKDGVSVYILTTGEIQINAGPDKEGKMHVKILNGIPWTKVYGYTIDAQ